MLDRPVFIVCQHRTGSTLLKNILDRSPDLVMATDEMAIYSPWRKSFLDMLEDMGDLSRQENVFRLVDLIYSGNIYGSFWRDYCELGIPKETVQAGIIRSDKSARGIIDVLLSEYLNRCDKQRVGVKNFVHFSRMDLLYDWYPDCEIIILVRDPRAMIASKLNSPGTKNLKRNHRALEFPIHYITLLFFALEYVWSSMVHIRYINNENVNLLRYEDMVLNPNHHIRELCLKCDIDFYPEMLDTHGKESSHTGSLYVGMDVSRLANWKQNLKRIDHWLIERLTGRAMKSFGYEDIDRIYGSLT